MHQHSNEPPIDYAALATEQRNPKSADLDRLSIEDILTLINQEDHGVPDAVGAEIPHLAQAVRAIVRALEAGGRVIYVGAGTSGRIGLLDALEWPPTFGVDPGIVRPVVAGGVAATVQSASDVEDDAAAGAAEIAALHCGPKDAVVGIAASGVTPFVLGAVAEARRCGATVIGVSCVVGSPLAAASAVAITPVVGPEVLTGSTRMKAGTAQKLVLNMLSTAAMVQRGKVYSNLMVDLSPGNRKLVARSQRVIADTTGLPLRESAKLLERAGGNVKVAIVMALAKVDRPTAESRLQQSGGHVRRALEQGHDADHR
jgi:N-acetylmuramic acid 6-phosphate etherase